MFPFDVQIVEAEELIVYSLHISPFLHPFFCDTVQ